MARTTIAARLDALDARLERLEAALVTVVQKQTKVSEPKARIATKDEGYTARRKRHEGGYCRKCSKGFAYEQGFRFHRTWCSGR